MSSFVCLEFGHSPSVRRAMFIDAEPTQPALRQEGHVSREGSTRNIIMALLTEGDAASLATSINIALLTEGGRVSRQFDKHGSPTEGST
jgi:hypothetical protein